MSLLRLDLLLRNSEHTDINSDSLDISQTAVRKPEKRSLCNPKKKLSRCLFLPMVVLGLFIRSFLTGDPSSLSGLCFPWRGLAG